ncbi:helix-turn-helix domain-containing protein [Roseibium sp. M-1]
MTEATGLHTPSDSLPPGIEAGFWRRQAPNELRHLFANITGYEERQPQINRQVETASLTIPFILSFGDPFEIGLGTHPTKDNAVPSFLAGLSSAPVYIQSNGRAQCLQVNFTPLGARQFFGLPMDLLSDRMLPVLDVADDEVAVFVRRIEDMTSWTARLDLAMAFVCTRLKRNTEALTPADHVFARLLETGGRASISALGAEIGWSRKHLAHRFRRDIGLLPKTVARLMRFGRVIRLSGDGRSVNWADLAADCGYADQAHLIRDFSEFSGKSPSGWQASLANNAQPAW